MAEVEHGVFGIAMPGQATGYLPQRKPRTFMILALTLIGLSGCDDAFPDYNYKMTIYANGKAFSSVRRVEQEEVASMVDSAGVRVERKLTGEAVIMDMGGQTYYALLSKPDNADYSTLIAGAALLPQGPAKKPRSAAHEAVAEYREENSGDTKFPNSGQIPGKFRELNSGDTKFRGHNTN